MAVGKLYRLGSNSSLVRALRKDEHDAQGLHIHTAFVETTFFGIGVGNRRSRAAIDLVQYAADGPSSANCATLDLRQ